MTLWRVFPWDPGTPEGRPYSPSFVPGTTGRGRFDLPARVASVLYLAESPEHAIAEVLHPWRGQRIDARHLRRAGHDLALVEIRTGRDGRRGLADLCDPKVLATLAIPSDHVASRHRTITQPIARAIWDAGYGGLRWWSRFWGDWHTVVLFANGAGPEAAFPRPAGEPAPLDLKSPALREATRLLGIEVAT